MEHICHMLGENDLIWVALTSKPVDRSVTGHQDSVLQVKITKKMFVDENGSFNQNKPTFNLKVVSLVIQEEDI